MVFKVLKKILVLALVFSFVFCQFSAYAAKSPPTLKAGAAILMDAKTSTIIYALNIHKKAAPASTTKILTAIIAIESNRLNEDVKISTRAAATRGSSMHLFAGQTLTLKELLAGLLLRSGNDAAVAIAEHLAGSVENFALLMNDKAKTLGALNSNFINPNGLTAINHYSTAFDLAIITKYALTNPTFAQLVNTKETSIDWLDKKGNERDINLKNTNRLLWMLEDADGVKTGTTDEAGPCLVSSATRGNQKLIAVVLHDHSRWYDSVHLLKYGFEAFDLYEYAEENEILGPLPVVNGSLNFVDVKIAQAAALIATIEDYPHITVECDIPEKLKAPIYEGQKIGEVIFFIKDKAVKTIDIVSTKEVKEETLTTSLFDFLLKIFRIISGWGLL